MIKGARAVSLYQLPVWLRSSVKTSCTKALFLIYFQCSINVCGTITLHYRLDFNGHFPSRDTLCGWRNWRRAEAGEAEDKRAEEEKMFPSQLRLFVQVKRLYISFTFG